MIIKRFVFVLIAVFCFGHAYAQSDEVCNAISTIVRDAPNKFRNVRGKTMEANGQATMWECSIKVPGTVGSRFVASMGLFYEGAFFQTANVNDLKEAYAKYKSILSACLLPKGYTLSAADNFSPGLKDYKKLIFMPKDADEPQIKSSNLPPHITMEVTYSKEVGKYTIVMFIFEH